MIHAEYEFNLIEHHEPKVLTSIGSPWDFHRTALKSVHRAVRERLSVKGVLEEFIGAEGAVTLDL